MENAIIKTIRVSEKGQIAIPIEIRKKLKIMQGDELIIIESNDKLLIEKSKRLTQKVQDDFKDILHYSEQSLKEVWDNSEDNIWSQYLKK